MRSTRRIAIAVAGIVVVAVLAGELWWRAESNRHDAMRAAVTSFEPPDEWLHWTAVGTTSRGFNPFCIDVRCPSYHEAYLVAVPEGSVKSDVVASIEALSLTPVSFPDRDCQAGSFCLFRAEGDSFEVSITVDDPLDNESDILSDPPPGFITIRVALSAA